MEVNTDFLLQLIDENKGSEFGIDHNFEDIHSVADFRRLVPISTYENYKDQIKRMMNGETNILTSHKIVHYSKSTGTQNIPKYLPMSETVLNNNSLTSTQYSAAASDIGYGWINGRVLDLIEGDIECLPCGATCGCLSAWFKKQIMDHLSIDINMMYTTPIEGSSPRPGTNSLYIQARFGLAEKDIGFIQSVFISSVLNMFQYIANNWRLLIKDIRNGTIDETIEMGKEVRSILLSKLQPQVQRADELEKIFLSTNTEAIAKKIWPSLGIIAGVGGGSFKMYTKQIQNFTGRDIHFMFKGLIASEGSLSLMYQLDNYSSVLLPNTLFYEFLTLTQGDEQQCLTIDQVQVGSEYEIVISTQSGLYRYRMGDIVKITGKVHNTPTIEFLSRTDSAVNIIGEKTSEYCLQQSVYSAAKKLGFKITEFSVYPQMFPVLRYVYFLEATNIPDYVSWEMIRQEIEKTLGDINELYAFFIKTGQFKPMILYQLQQGTYHLYKRKLTFNGASNSQVKPIHVLVSQKHKEFFFSLVQEIIPLGMCQEYGIPFIGSNGIAQCKQKDALTMRHINNTWILSLTGKIEREVTEMINSNLDISQIVIDLNDIECLTSLELCNILDIACKLKVKNIKFSICNAIEQTLLLLDATGISGLIPIYH